MVPTGSCETTVHTGAPVAQEIWPVLHAWPVAQAAPSLQGTHTPELLQTEPTPQTVPAGCAPASTQVSTGRPPAELRQLMMPRRQGSDAMKQAAPMRQLMSSGVAQVNC